MFCFPNELCNGPLVVLNQSDFERTICIDFIFWDHTSPYDIGEFPTCEIRLWDRNLLENEKKKTGPEILYDLSVYLTSTNPTYARFTEI